MAESTRPGVAGFNHIALEVGDIEDAPAFYGRLFAATLQCECGPKDLEAAFASEREATQGPREPGGRVGHD
jgi:predicted enzyme related to lactoylglutathione lyase